MNTLLLEPLKYYESAALRHSESVAARFDELVKASGIDTEQNRKTVAKYKEKLGEIEKVNSKISKFKLLFWSLIIACIGIGIAAVLVLNDPPESSALFVSLMLSFIAAVIVILIIDFKKVRPIIKDAEGVKAKLTDEANGIRSVAEAEMAPLNALFNESDTLSFIEKTMPEIKFNPYYSPKDERLLIDRYDYIDLTDDETSVIDTLSGRLLDNPFLYERYIEHTMGSETYRGSLTIHWTERRRDSKGNMQTVHRTQVLTASVVKPKPTYKISTHLGYGCEAAPDLSFSRTESDTDELSEGALARRIRRGAKKLQKRAQNSVGGGFQEMANSEFDVLFGAHDRSHEVQFRLMYTPLAQNNTVDLLRSKVGYGDDFNFIKQGKYNIIKTVHAQNWRMRPSADIYKSYDVDASREAFISYNNEYFKSVFFDVAPLLAVPAYHDNTPHSAPEGDYAATFTQYEHEVLANAIGAKAFAHPDTATDVILKTRFAGRSGDADRVQVTAYSYRAEERTDYVPTLGGDGRTHRVPVHWTKYIPISATRTMTLKATAKPEGDAYVHGISATVN